MDVERKLDARCDAPPRLLTRQSYLQRLQLHDVWPLQPPSPTAQRHSLGLPVRCGARGWGLRLHRPPVGDRQQHLRIVGSATSVAPTRRQPRMAETDRITARKIKPVDAEVWRRTALRWIVSAFIICRRAGVGVTYRRPRDGQEERTSGLLALMSGRSTMK